MMQKGSGVVGFLAYVVNVGVPGQGVGVCFCITNYIGTQGEVCTVKGL